MKYKKIDDIPSTAEVAFRIDKNDYNVYIAGTAKACINYIATHYDNNCEVHEVVLDKHKCKPFADIEYTVPLIDKQLYDDCLDKILQIILECCDIFAISRSGMRLPSTNDIIVGDASRVIEQENKEPLYKYSYHVVVKHLMLSDIEDAKLFGSLIRAKLVDAKLKDWIDMGVYRKRANFRTMMTPKNGVIGSRFQVENKYVGWSGNCEQSLITIDHKKLLGDGELDVFSFESMYGEEFMQRNSNKIKIDEDISNELKPMELYAALLKLKSKKFSFNLLKPRSHELNGNKIDLIRIDMKSEIFCGICEREHSNENIFLAVHPVHGITYMVTAHCYRRYSETIAQGPSEFKPSNVLIIGYYNISLKTMSAEKQDINQLIECSADENFVAPKFQNSDITMLKLKWRQMSDIKRSVLKQLEKDSFETVINNNDEVYVPHNLPTTYRISDSINKHGFEVVDSIPDYMLNKNKTIFNEEDSDNEENTEEEIVKDESCYGDLPINNGKFKKPASEVEQVSDPSYLKTLNNLITKSNGASISSKSSVYEKTCYAAEVLDFQDYRKTPLNRSKATKPMLTESDYSLVPNIKSISGGTNFDVKDVVLKTIVANKERAIISVNYPNPPTNIPDVDKFNEDVLESISYCDHDNDSSTFESLQSLFDEDENNKYKFNVVEVNQPVVPNCIEDLEFVDSNTVYVCSDPGTAKSKNIVEYARRNLDKSMLIVIPRRTLAIAYHAQLRDYGFHTHIYDTVRNAQLHLYNRVICVVNSIHAINIERNYDVVVFDELVSIFAQLPSTGVNLNDCVAKIDHVVRYCSKLLVLDAHLSYLSIEPIMELRFMKPGDQTLLINNHLTGKNHTWHVTTSDYVFMNELIRQCRNGDKIIVCLTTRSMVNAMKQFLEHMAPNRKIIEITGETPKLSKASFIENLDQLLEDGYVLLYNTAITVGVSTLIPVKSVFMYNNNQSVLQEFHYQQSRRARCCDNFYVLFGYLTNRNLPKTKQALSKNIDHYLDAISESLPIPYRFSLAWKRKMFQECVALKLLITNILINNNSVSNPDEKMITLIKMTGATIKKMEPSEEQIIIDHDFKMTDMTATLKSIIASKIEEADQINRETDAAFADLLLEYRKIIETKHEIDDKLKSRLMAIEFRRAYNITSSSITESTVLDYFFKHKLREQYSNITKMLQHKDYKDLMSTYLEEMINNISKDSVIAHLNRSVHRSFTYPHSQRMVRLFEIMGIDHPVAANGTLVDVTTDEVTKVVGELKNLLNCRPNTDDRAEANTKIINKLLSNFGMSLKKLKKGKDGCMAYRVFTLSNMFEYKPERCRGQYNFTDKPIVFVAMK